MPSSAGSEARIGSAEVPTTTIAPLVSVLVRSMGRATLHEALASVAAQTDPGIEVVVVNASGRPHPALPPRCGRFELRLVEPGVPLARAAAANCALEAARGEWLIFLDDDDLFDPDHVARLRAAAQALPDAAVAYAGVRVLAGDGHLLRILDEPFDRLRLWQANQLPIHAVLFSRRFVDAGLRLDESLPVYEDWDFWQQLARHTSFLHVSGVSASYRMLGDSGLGAQHDEVWSRTWRTAFYRKWLPQLTSAELERLSAAAEHARGDRDVAIAAADRAEAKARQAQVELAALDAEWRAAQRDLATLRTALAEEQAARTAAQAAAQASSAAHAAVEADLRAALSEYVRLERGYRQVTSSLSWRITAPLRSVRALASTAGLRLALRRLLRTLPLAAANKQRVKTWLTARPWGQQLLRHLLPHTVPAAAVTVAAAFDKEAVRADAEAELGRFLAGTERIALHRGAGVPRVSVIVVLYNQAGLSLLCLRALAASRGVDFETLIVDNASSDRMPALLQRLDGATVLPQTQNLGFLRAVNLAAAAARGEHLLLLNNDALVEPDTLARAVARLQADRGAGAVGGPILLWDGRLQEAGSIVWRDGSCLGYGRDDVPEAPAYRFVRDVDYCSGAFLMVRRSLFEALGGFDEAFAPAYYEETDFCARLWEAGHRIVYDPAVRVRHFEFASTAPASAIELQQRHRALFVQRHAAFLAAQCANDRATLLRARQRLRAGARRVLVIDDRVPLPWLGQGYPRAASMVAAIAARGDFVTHYPLQFPHESSDDVARALPETVEVMLGLGLAGLGGFLQQRGGLYDVVIVSRPHNMAALREALQLQPQALQGARIAYDAEALFSLRDIARAQVLGQPMPMAEQRQRIDAEMALARGADCIVAVSEPEAAHYRQAGYADVQVLGHALRPRPSAMPFEARQGFLFVGALPADDTPNADSLRWFVREVWPRVQAATGGKALLRIVGQCEAPSVRALAGPTVHLAGAAVDLGPALDAARVFIVPTRYAAGVPHKAHEAAARGLPMVVTPLIAAQLGWQACVPTGEDAERFAAECVRLHDDAAHWRSVREGLLQAVQADCAPEAFERTLQAVLGRNAGAARPDVASMPAAAPCPVPAASAAGSAEERTAELWGRDARQRVAGQHLRQHWSSHPTTAAEINRLVSGDPAIGWMAHLKQAHFPTPAQRGLSLGSGSGAVSVDAVQLGIVQQMEGLDLSAEAVQVARQRAAAAGLEGRVQFRVADLNHVALQGPYDLVLFEQSLHHVDALDAVLQRCRGALAPGGRFVINEYVGPDRFQWTDEAERLMNRLLELLPPSLRIDPASGAPKRAMVRATPQQVIDVDASEAIHSAQILAACERHFELVERKDFGGTLLQFMLAGIVANFDPDDVRDAALLRLMSLLETELTRAGALRSDFVYAVYRAR